MSPSNQPPPQYASYPRGLGSPGDAERLRLLSDGYFGLNQAFGITFVVVIAVGILNATTRVAARSDGTVRSDGFPVILPAALVLLPIIVGFVVYPKMKRVGEGLNWSPSGVILATVLVALNSLICFGAIGFVIVQSMLSSEMKKYGVQGRFSGIKKKDVEQRIAELRAV